jgi:hypothetical protein
MSCRGVWSLEFLNSILPASFLKKEYRDMREKVLLESEKQYLPACQPEAERRLKIIDIEKKIDEQFILKQENYANENQMVFEQRQKEKIILKSISDLDKKRVELSTKKSTGQRHEFVMPCPLGECRGFLSTQYKCGLCSNDVCKDCHHAKSETHVCDPNEVATVTELRQNTKPCPKCHAPIFKIDGCDQMFCIRDQCHTAFSWRTGQVEKGIIHNPHYFEFVKEKGAGTVARNPFDIPCGGLPDYTQVYHMMAEYSLGQDEISYLRVMYENVGQHREITMRHLPNEQEQLNHRDLTLDYILQKYSESQYKAMLYVREQKRQRGLEERQMLEAYLAVAEEAFRKLAQLHISFDEFLTEIEHIKVYTRREINELNQRYQHTGFLNAIMI